MYNKRYKKSNKIMYVMCTIIVILIYTISVCYSTLSRNLEISGLVKVRMQADIRVTGISIESNTDSVSNWEEYNVKNISSEVDLLNNDSSITYKVRITNFGNVDMGIYTIDGLNDKLEYTLREYTMKDKISKGGTQKDIYITIKYKDGSYDANNTKYNILLNFDFRPYYTITYTNFPSDTSSLPQEIIKGDTLELDLNQYGKSRVTIKLDGLELSNIGYTYDNYKLNIPSVEGNIEIIYKKIPEIELALRENDNNKTLSEDIQAGMYRYQGSYEKVTNNYICFGTSSKEECLQNEDKYMYRIIGITDDGQLELIKMTALNDTGVQWDSLFRSEWNTNTEVNEKTVDADVPWSESDLYKRLNGLSDNNDNLFIGNDTYDYLSKDSIWYNKISDTNWLSGALLWDAESFKLENIYKIETGQKEAPYYEEANPYYYNGGIEIVANTEPYVIRRNEDNVICEKFENDVINKVTCYKEVNATFNDKINAKIGLMHVYDFDYAVQKNGFDCLQDNVFDTEKNQYKEEIKLCQNSWIHINNNDTSVTGGGVYDWAMSHHGFTTYADVFTAWDVHPTGDVIHDYVYTFKSARPVFYLTPDIIIKEGTTGAKDNPYRIEFNACHYDGELSPGVTYIDNDYTYRYMQEGYFDDWQDIDIDGWGVMLTDKNSTKPVNSELCTSINGKPIVSMSYMFGDSQAESVDVSSYDTSNVTNMANMFYGIEVDNVDVSNFNTSSVTNMSGMFSYSYIDNIIGLEKFDTSNVNDFIGMFGCIITQSIDISNWNFDSANYLSGIFNASEIDNLTWNNYELTDEVAFEDVFTGSEIMYLNIENWKISGISNLYNEGILYQVSTANLLADNWDITAVPDFNFSMLFGDINAGTIDISNWKLRNSSFLSGSAPSYFSVNDLIIQNWDITSHKDGIFQFEQDFLSIFGEYLTYLDLSGWKVDKFFFTNIDGEYIEDLILDNWDLTNVTDLSNVFNNFRTSLLDLSTWDVSHIENFDHIFKNAYISNLYIHTWDFDYNLEMFGDVEYLDVESTEPIGLSNCYLKNIWVPKSRESDLLQLFSGLQFISEVMPMILGI